MIAWGLLLAGAIITGAAASPWEPTHWPPPTPGVYTGSPQAREQPGFAAILYDFYHNRISGRDGARCPYYPTCSAYGLQSIQRRGWIVGTLLVTDRLLREYPWMQRFDHYPFITPHDTPRLYDPVPPRRSRPHSPTPGSEAP